jgi:hypothetical protein
MIENEDSESLFNSIGFGFPANGQELEAFEKLFKNYLFKADVSKLNPEAILKSIGKNVKEKNNVDYHKRIVLAAEIVYRLKDEWSLGHLKLQKLLYLCQNAMKITLQTNFLQQAMGPYDPRLMRSIDSQFEKRKWFIYRPETFPMYVPLEKAGEHEEWFKKYYGEKGDQIDFIIETFRKMKTTDVELVATIFACWRNILALGQSATEDSIVEKVYAWSPEKAKFTKVQIQNMINWMIEKNIVPTPL